MKAKLGRIQKWFYVNFVGIFIFPFVKMDFLHIVSYPDAPYENAKLLGLSPWKYWLLIEHAMTRESAVMLDNCGFVTEQTEYAKHYMNVVYKELIRETPIIWKVEKGEDACFDKDRFPNKYPPRY